MIFLAKVLICNKLQLSILLLKVITNDITWTKKTKK